MSLAEPIKQNGSEEVDNDKDVRVSVVRGKKITITTACAILAGGKQLTRSIKVTLLKGE